MRYIAEHPEIIALIVVGWFGIGCITAHLFGKVMRCADAQNDKAGRK